MRAEIISVGTELLLGDILNTNAQYLAQQLAALGYTVYYQTVVGDNAGRLRQTIYDAKERSDVLVFTGGLGPTKDDLTKETVADAFGDSLVLDTDELVRLEYFFKKRGMPMSENNRKQAMVPKSGQKLPNPNGTAPGAWFRQGGKYAVLLPGPPSEMRPMFEEYVKPLLEAMQDGVIRSTTLRVFGVGESILDEMLAPLLAGSNPTVALYAKTGEVHIRVSAKAANAEQADIMCEQTAGLVRDALGDAIYSDNGDDLAATVVRLLIEEGASLATAESCTGGLLSQRLTGVPGASAVFGYGAVTYANEAKHAMLRVKNGTLRRYGAVSSQVAAEMAFGAAASGGADYGVGITGIAGPDGGSEQKPVGLVYVAVASGSAVTIRRLSINDRGREYVREVATHHALDMTRRAILGLPIPDSRRFTKGQQADLDWQGKPRRRGARALRVALALLVAALVLLVVGVLASRGSRKAPEPDPGLPSAQGLSYGTAEYTAAACRLVAERAEENPSVTGFVALPGAVVEGLVAQVPTADQHELQAAAGKAGDDSLALMAGSAAPGAAGTNTVVLGGEAFEPLLEYRHSARAPSLSTFTYYTARDARVYEVFAVYLYDEGGPQTDAFDPEVETLQGTTGSMDFLLGARARSLVEAPVDTAGADSYMALAVADPDAEGRRLYLAGRLLRPGEAAPGAGGAVPAGSPLMPAAWYAQQNLAVPDTEDLYIYWLQRQLTQEVGCSGLQLAAGMPAADAAPLVWRTGRTTPAPASSAPPASSQESGSSGGSGGGAETSTSGSGAGESGSPAASSSGESGSAAVAARLAAATPGAASSSAAESASAGESSGATSAPSVEIPESLSIPPVSSSSYTPPLIAERPDPGYLTVTMNGEVVTDTTATVLAWICQRECAALPDEAIKAVAVAAHSWILNQQGAGLAAPPVVGSAPSAALLATVQQVADTVLSADGKAPAFCPWFASSAAGTNSSAAVWGAARPYLAGVASPYEQDRSGWRQIVTLTAEEVAGMAAGWLGVDLMALGAPESWFAEVVTTEYGYVESLNLGGVPLTGLELWNRVLVRNGEPVLPSPAFEVSYKGSAFSFVTYGAGHGCGMSLSGAAGYAQREGWGYERILAFYYPGTELMDWS